MDLSPETCEAVSGGGSAVVGVVSAVVFGEQVFPDSRRQLKSAIVAHASSHTTLVCSSAGGLPLGFT